MRVRVRVRERVRVRVRVRKCCVYTAEVCRLALLEDLRVAGNRLATLPEELGALRRLRLLAVLYVFMYICMYGYLDIWI